MVQSYSAYTARGSKLDPLRTIPKPHSYSARVYDSCGLLPAQTRSVSQWPEAFLQLKPELYRVSQQYAVGMPNTIYRKSPLLTTALCAVDSTQDVDVVSNNLRINFPSSDLIQPPCLHPNTKQDQAMPHCLFHTKHSVVATSFSSWKDQNLCNHYSLRPPTAFHVRLYQILKSQNISNPSISEYRLAPRPQSIFPNGRARKRAQSKRLPLPDLRDQRKTCK